jgi:3-dehydroquinate synthase
MPESFEVSTSVGSYKVIVGEGLLASIAPSEHAIFLVDQFHLSSLDLKTDRLIAIPALESSKNLDYIPQVIEQMRKLGANRQTHVYAIGGGIIQDIATFVNSIYMRGIAWTYFPSTLLSMADSCIGGKSSINVAGYKNLVGNIYPPSAVYVDMDFCKTLGKNEIIGGLAEAVKICFARGPEFFDAYLELSPLYPLSGEKGVKVVSQALQAKKWFIEIDEFDQSERLLLNYGHTFGHALEASSNFALAHGVAVAIGMLVAIEYATQAQNLSGIGKTKSSQLERYIIDLIEPLKQDLGEILSQIDLASVMQKFEGDKKHQQDFYRMIIPSSSGGLVITSAPKNTQSLVQIQSAYENTFLKYGFIVNSAIAK